MLCFFIIFNRLKIRVVAAGCSDLNAVGIAVRMWENAVIKAFCLVRALLNGYGQEVNGLLIHANRLAFGWARGYLYIDASSWQIECSLSLDEKLGAVSW